jgi:hypothetical protein
MLTVADVGTGGKSWYIGPRSGSGSPNEFNFFGDGALRFGLNVATGTVKVHETTPSTASTNGALVVNGGLGVGKQLNVGDKTTITTAASDAFRVNGSASSSINAYYDNVCFFFQQMTPTPGNMAAIDFRTANGNSAGALGLEYVSHTSGLATGRLHFYTALAAGGGQRRLTIDENYGTTLAPSMPVPAGGTVGMGHKFAAATNFGIFFGSGVPTLSAAQGSLYLRSDGAVNARLYINTNGSTGWTAFNTTS